ncbi:MAG: hypothetical protein HPY53_07465 [Brevinematales bacterium]|nr:hypothetical protein [Brevinematales bacterium]
MILHGIYDNGKIEIKEKNLPNIRLEIEINLPVDTPVSSRFTKALQIIDNYHGNIETWSREEIHER